LPSRICLFTHIRRSDHVLLVLNLLLLLGVITVPFPTAVLAENLGQPGERTATLLYSGTYVVIAIAFNVLWRYATSRNRRLPGSGCGRNCGEANRGAYSFGPLFYLVCFALAWVSVPASLVLNVVLACFFALPPAYLRRPSGIGRRRRSHFDHLSDGEAGVSTYRRIRDLVK